MGFVVLLDWFLQVLVFRMDETKTIVSRFPPLGALVLVLLHCHSFAPLLGQPPARQSSRSPVAQKTGSHCWSHALSARPQAPGKLHWLPGEGLRSVGRKQSPGQRVKKSASYPHTTPACDLEQVLSHPWASLPSPPWGSAHRNLVKWDGGSKV